MGPDTLYGLANAVAYLVGGLGVILCLTTLIVKNRRFH